MPDEDINLSTEAVQKAIETVKGKSWDVNPFTVADELKVSRAVIYRHQDAMQQIIAARGGSFGMDVQTSLDLTAHLRKLEQEKNELMQKLAGNEGQPVNAGQMPLKQESAVPPWANADELIVNYAGSDPYLADYYSQIKDLSWKDIETIYYFKVSSLKDHAKNLFSNGNKSVGTNGEESLSSQSESIATQSVTYGSLGNLGKADRPAFVSPFARLKTSKTNLGQLPQESLLEPIYKTEAKKEIKEELAKIEESVPIQAAPFFQTLAERQAFAKPQTFIEPSSLTGPPVVAEPPVVAGPPVVAEPQIFVEPEIKDKEIDPKAKPDLEQQSLIKKMTEIPMQLASQIRAKLTSEVGLAKENKILSQEVKTGADEITSSSIPVDWGVPDESEKNALSEIESKWRQAFGMPLKSDLQPDWKIEESNQSETHSQIELEIQVRAKEDKAEIIDQAETVPPVVTSVSEIVVPISPVAEPKLLPLLHDKEEAAMGQSSDLVTGDQIILAASSLSNEVDTGDIAPVEGAVATESEKKQSDKKEADKKESQEKSLVSGDELRNLIQSHIKNAAEQMADAHSIGTGKEFEVWLNNPSRSKFIGSTKNQEANSNNEENTNTSNAGTFKPKVVPPEVRKSCLILGVRMDNITYEVVQDAWKKAIAAPGVHPDQGGDTELAVYLNTAKDVLMRWLDAQAPKLGKKFGQFKKEKDAQPKQG